MEITVLGCGTSHGVPMITCGCDVCRSDDHRNKRLRPSILVTADSGGNVLVDTPPEMRLAVIANDVQHVEAVLFTHSHADHIFGMDDIRPFNYKQGGAMMVYAEPAVQNDIKRIFEYAFKPGPVAGGRPRIELALAEPSKPLRIADMDITPLRVYHGELPILAYKFGRKFAYVTDVSRIPEESMDQLQGLDVLMLDAVRREKHETHFNLEQALEAITLLQPKQTYLTHLSHDFDYVQTNAELPPGVALTYDGHRFCVPSS